MNKSPDAFRTISEVAELLETPAHVLRFWESRFPQIKPVKRAGGRRYYRPADMALLSGIRRLLHDEGMTIRGVQKILREQGVKHVSGMTDDDEADDNDLPVEDGVVVAETVESSAPIPLFPILKAALPSSPTEPEEAEAQSDSAEQKPAETPHDTPEVAAASFDETTIGTPPGHDDSEPDQEPALPKPELSADTLSDQGDDTQDLTSGPSMEASSSDTTSAADAEVTPEPPPPEENKATPPQEPVALPAATSEPVVEPAPATRNVPARKALMPLPGPLPQAADIRCDALAADLRKLPPDAFGKNLSQAQALFARLEALRNRVGDLGRVPRR